MNRVFFVALFFAFLCCVFAVPAYAQLSLCTQCHTSTFLQNLTAGNAYNCNYGNQTGLTQCGWVPLITKMRSNAASSPKPVIWSDADVAAMIAYLEIQLPVALPVASFLPGTAGVPYAPLTLTGVQTAGNAANPRAQVITAAGEGSAAAISINADLVEKDVRNARHAASEGGRTTTKGSQSDQSV